MLLPQVREYERERLCEYRGIVTVAFLLTADVADTFFVALRDPRRSLPHDR